MAWEGGAEAVFLNAGDAQIVGVASEAGICPPSGSRRLPQPLCSNRFSLTPLFHVARGKYVNRSEDKNSRRCPQIIVQPKFRHASTPAFTQLVPNFRVWIVGLQNVGGGGLKNAEFQFDASKAQKLSRGEHALAMLSPDCAI